MPKFVILVCLLLFVQGCALAEVSPTVTGTLGKPENMEKVTATIGHDWVLFIRSEARWDEFRKLLPDLTPETPLPKLDWAKQSMVLVYVSSCRRADTFTRRKADLAANPPEVAFSLRTDNSPKQVIESRFTKFILAVIPVTPTVRVTFDIQPLNGWCGAILGGEHGGDIVDNLQATITPKAATIKPGEDILIDFALNVANPGHAARPELLGTVFVWDGEYSNGYRNHAFFVTTPDGKTALLRPKPIEIWEKNRFHPVEITAYAPYHLLSAAAQSLKELGLDTSTPGTYTITGLYEETASVEGKTPMWGGSITSNTITVEVKK